MANNIDVKDAASATKTLKTTDTATVHVPHHNVDVIAAGDNNIGNVDVVTLPALPAGTNNIGDVDVLTLPSPPSVFYMGQTNVTTAGTEVTIASTQAITMGVTVKAKHGNTGFIYVGTNPVTSTTGYVLRAGESVFVAVANLTTVFIDSSVNGEGVSYVGS